MLFWLLLALLPVALSSCSAKKNTAASRKYQAFITRYNVYYNGNEHFKETLGDMERKYEDDYTGIIYPHPAEAKANPKAPQPSGDFTRSIEKAQKAIQLHSIKKRPKRSGKSTPEQKEWLKREEYNPFIHNAWLMMARSQYLNGDYSGAAATFYYISRHFKWLPETVTEAQLWQARSYVAFDWVNEAEAIYRRIKPEQLTSKKLRELYDFVGADIAVRRGDYADAIKPLEAAVKSASGAQKVRLRFLLGQCLEREGRNAEAYKQFKSVAGSSNSTYRTKLNARIKQSEVFSGKDIGPEVRSLKHMTSLGRNSNYLDQIYYAIGNLYLSRQDTAKAIENYILASEKSKRNGIEKAINNITLGQIYFAQGRYDLAQPRFSEAVPQLSENYPNYALLKKRSDVLDELAVYSQNVTLQDSLLRLSELPEEEVNKIIDKIIEELKKKEKEEAENAARAEHEANKPGQTLDQGANAPTQFQMTNKDDSWYFYNTATVAQGRTEFQRRWGSRKLEDDWRRRNKASFSFNDFSSEDSESSESSETSESSESSKSPEQTEEDKQAAERAQDPHYREYYLAQIPKTEEQKTTANEVIQDGLFNMGVILKDKLEDFPAAQKEWAKLLERYPDNVYRLDVYYNEYMMLMRQDKPAEAEKWRQLILSDFADTKYGNALQDPDYIQHLREMPAAQQQLYDQAYEAYMANDNRTVHRVYKEMEERYPMSEIMPKFMFLEALSYVTEREPEKFNSTLREMLERYPETDMTTLASSYLKGMAQGRKLNEGVSNQRGMIWDIHLSATNDSTGGPTEAAKFDFDPNQQQVIALVYSTADVSPNELLYQIARHNFNTFVVKDFDLEQMNFGQLGVLLIKGFANLSEAEHYRDILAKSQVFSLPEAVTPVIMAEKNFQTLVSQGRTFEEYFRAAGDAHEEQTEAAIEQAVEESSENSSESDAEAEAVAAGAGDTDD